MFRKLILLLVSAATLVSSSVFAVGLGEYKLNSGLNQPLNAEIKLLSAGDLSEHEVSASLASSVEFEKVGVERDMLLNNIVFQTKKNANGSITVLLSSREPIKEPFLNFLVELNWPNGRIIREYTFLLDPPIFEESASSTIQKTQVREKKSSQNREPQRHSVSQQVKPSYTGSTYGPVAANDTLWGIASKVRPNSQTSIHQTLVAIYRANPDAFSNGNINNLLRGKVLTIPDANTIEQIPHRAALQDVVMQNKQWQAGGARSIVENSSEQVASKKRNSDARLTLSSPTADADSEGNVSGELVQKLNKIENQLVVSQETSATLQAENEELRARLADALNQLGEKQTDSAITIADTELAVLTQAKVNTNEPSETEGSEDIVADTSLIDSTEEIIDTDGIEEEIVDESTEADETLSEVASQLPQSTTIQASQIEPEVISKPVFVDRKEKSLFDELIDSGSLLWGGLGLVVLVILGVFWRMRKRMEEDDFQDDLVASAGIGKIDINESFELPDVGDDMLVELEMDDSDRDKNSSDENFDPLGEADIYIAYGKYDQAEKLLLDSIEENPIRSDLKVKLMECYAETDSRDKFDSLAEEVAQAVDAEEWKPHVAKLRQDTWAGGVEEGFDLPSTEDIFGADEFDPSAENDFSTEQSFDALDAESEQEFDIDMNLGGDDASTPDAKVEAFDSLDDEFSMDSNDAGFDVSEPDIELDDSDDISLDLDDEDFSFDESSDELETEDSGDGDEISTKLDLARAYIDMGDIEGAKEILSEVMSEGSSSQKDEAQTLLDKME